MSTDEAKTPFPSSNMEEIIALIFSLLMRFFARAHKDEKKIIETATTPIVFALDRKADDNIFLSGCLKSIPFMSLFPFANIVIAAIIAGNIDTSHNAIPNLKFLKHLIPTTLMQNAGDEQENAGKIISASFFVIVPLCKSLSVSIAPIGLPQAIEARKQKNTDVFRLPDGSVSAMIPESTE
ncbi:MAG: hypothetical protein IJN63_11055 [Clostridia bacterium]|nr:hypothetical protein [Clostridia bacterium]